MTSDQIVNCIREKEKEHESSVPQDYFVGLTDNPEKRMFYEHNINRDDGFYAYCEASSQIEANKAFDKLLEYDMNGLPIDDQMPGKYVYFYFVNSATKECCAKI